MPDASIFHGAFTALITPFRDGQIDTEALAALVDAQIAGGISGLVPCGTTGEAATLSYAEHIKVIELTMKAVDGRVPVLAGAGANSTREAIELGRAAKELGVDGILSVTPYYNKPPQDGLVRHFHAQADAVGLPIVLYNVPGRTGCDMLPPAVEAAAAHDMIVGIKEATGDMNRVTEIRERCGPDFVLLSGDDFTLLPFLAAGGHGVISVVTNVVPNICAEMCKAVLARDLDTARELHQRQMPLIRALFRDANPIPVKAAMAALGRCANEVRLPLRALPEDSELHTDLVRLTQALGSS